MLAAGKFSNYPGFCPLQKNDECAAQIFSDINDTFIGQIWTKDRVFFSNAVLFYEVVSSQRVKQT